ncbi:MAG: ferrous iron transporter B, partial [Clostridia bacterium]|nr:ferrous iron transporter B [Clostridia bacterium]
MDIRIALAGNPNSGKTTLFNALTGSNQFVGNWPGVTVEKKEGRLKGRDGVTVTDLPGIYSLSPYTLEEVVARNYLIGERPDAILNIVDGTNLERNLYLTTQLTELGIPVVVAVNMIDLVGKSGDRIDLRTLSERIGCPCVGISALKGTGVREAADAAIRAAESGKTVPTHTFSGPVEHALAHIEEAALHGLPEERQRWYAIKLFERDDKVRDELGLSDDVLSHLEQDIVSAESELDDDAESIITNERYIYIGELIKACFKKKERGALSVSDKIDRIVTNRWLGLPIFAAVMFLVYYISMVTVGSWATDWANDGLFGDGYHLFGIGSAAAEAKADEYTAAANALDAFGFSFDAEDGEFDKDAFLAEIRGFSSDKTSVKYTVADEETLKESEIDVYFSDIPDGADEETTNAMSFKDAVEYFSARGSFDEPDPADDGVWVPGIPALLDMALLDEEGEPVVPEWLYGLIQKGIVAGVGS